MEFLPGCTHFDQRLLLTTQPPPVFKPKEGKSFASQGLEPGKLDYTGLLSRQFQIELAKPQGYDAKEPVQIFTILKAVSTGSREHRVRS